jgi:hypothetical protein
MKENKISGNEFISVLMEEVEDKYSVESASKS